MSNQNKNIAPMTPKEVINQVDTVIPSFMIEAINNLLKKNFRGHTVGILQAEITEEAIRIAKKHGKDVTATEIFNEQWMNFEPVFEKAGWSIDYDSPGFNESYEPIFYFNKAEV